MFLCSFFSLPLLFFMHLLTNDLKDSNWTMEDLRVIYAVKCIATIMAVFRDTNDTIVHLPKNHRSSTVMYAHFHHVVPIIFALICEKSIKLSTKLRDQIDWLLSHTHTHTHIFRHRRPSHSHYASYEYFTTPSIDLNGRDLKLNLLAICNQFWIDGHNEDKNKNNKDKYWMKPTEKKTDSFFGWYVMFVWKTVWVSQQGKGFHTMFVFLTVCFIYFSLLFVSFFSSIWLTNCIVDRVVVINDLCLGAFWWSFVLSACSAFPHINHIFILLPFPVIFIFFCFVNVKSKLWNCPTNWLRINFFSPSFHVVYSISITGDVDEWLRLFRLSMPFLRSSIQHNKRFEKTQNL